MKEYLVRWRERYTKVLKDYPELREVSNLFAISACAGRDEQKLQQKITAALICDDPYCYDKRNVMNYNLEDCDTPSKHNFHSNSPVSYELMVIFNSLRHFASNPRQSFFYATAVERLEQIYFTL